jgi:zinc transport system permease protein
MDTSFWQDLLAAAFLRRAVLGMALTAVICGVIGSYVLAQRRSYMVGAVSHSLLGGIALARYAQVAHGLQWFTPLLGALLAGCLAGMAVSLLTLRGRMREDSVLSALWSLGVALGVSIIAITPGYAEDLNSYLFGSIMMISASDLWIMAAMVLILLALAWIYHPRFLALCFHEEGLRLRGVSSAWVSMLLQVMTAITVALLSQVVGIVLVLALLVLPVATAALFVRRIGAIMLLSAVLCFAASFGGLYVSYGPNLPVAATIVELAAAGYVLAALARWLWRRWRR